MRFDLTVTRAKVGGAVSTRAKTIKGYKMGFARGVVKAAKLLLKKSREIVPIDTKALYYSSKVVEYGRGQSKVAEVTYTMPYGVYVHEDLNKKHKPPTQAKFLEQPARQYRQEMRNIIKKETLKR